MIRLQNLKILKHKKVKIFTNPKQEYMRHLKNQFMSSMQMIKTFKKKL